MSCLVRKQVEEPESAIGMLTRRYTNWGRCDNLRHGFIVMCRNRFFAPARPILRHRTHRLERHNWAESSVELQHQIDVVANCLANCLYHSTSLPKLIECQFPSARAKRI